MFSGEAERNIEERGCAVAIRYILTTGCDDISRCCRFIIDDTICGVLI
jgi:hypothetical protein